MPEPDEKPVQEASSQEQHGSHHESDVGDPGPIDHGPVLQDRRPQHVVFKLSAESEIAGDPGRIDTGPVDEVQAEKPDEDQRRDG